MNSPDHILLSLAVLAPVEVLCDGEPAERVARVVEVPVLARLVDQSAPGILAAEQQVLLQGLAIEEPRVRGNGRRV